MKKLIAILLCLILVTSCQTNDDLTIKKIEYTGDHYNYEDLNYFLDKHGYIGEGSYLDEGNELNISSSTSTFTLDDERSIKVTFLDRVQYDLKTVPVKKDASCDIRCDDMTCICDLSDTYIQVDNMLFEKRDSDIAEYIQSEGMKKKDEGSTYNITSTDDFLALLDENGIEDKTEEIKTDLRPAVSYDNTKVEGITMASSINITTDTGNFNLYQLFEDPYEKDSAYALEYVRDIYKGDELIPCRDIGITIDNLILEVIDEDERVISLFRSANW